jgi:hypothetical protein
MKTGLSLQQRALFELTPTQGLIWVNLGDFTVHIVTTEITPPSSFITRVSGILKIDM